MLEVVGSYSLGRIPNPKVPSSNLGRGTTPGTGDGAPGTRDQEATGADPRPRLAYRPRNLSPTEADADALISDAQAIIDQLTVIPMSQNRSHALVAGFSLRSLNGVR